MLSFELRARIDDVLQVVERVQQDLEVLTTLSKYYERGMLLVQGIAFGAERATQATALIYAHLANTQSAIAHHSTRKAFAALGRLESSLETFAALEVGPFESISSARSNVEIFADALDSFLRQPSGENAWTLLQSAHRTHQMLYGIVGVLQVIATNLESDRNYTDEAATLTILLPSKDHLQGFLTRLQALQYLYSELCRLLDVNEIDHPLAIAKIETGSLWAKLFGESRVIALIERFLTEGAGFIYRSYTREGKIVTLPRQVESLDKILQLRAALCEQGLASAELDEELKHSAFLIARTLSEVLERQPSVQINGRTVSVGEQELQDRIAADHWPQLEAPSANREVAPHPVEEKGSK